MSDDPSGEHLTTEDVARLAGVSGAAVRAAMLAGRITPAHTTIGSRFHIYHLDEALRFAAVRDRVAKLRTAMKQTWRDGK